MADFPDGPFFNFRCKDEFPRWKRVVWKLFGIKRTVDDGNYIITAYYFKNVTYISKVDIYE